jgi:hypothetical protein
MAKVLNKKGPLHFKFFYKIIEIKLGGCVNTLTFALPNKKGVVL